MKKVYIKKFKDESELDPMQDPETYGFQQLMKNVVRNFLPVSVDLDIQAKNIGFVVSISAELNLDNQGIFYIIQG